MNNNSYARVCVFVCVLKVHKNQFLHMKQQRKKESWQGGEIKQQQQSRVYDGGATANETTAVTRATTTTTTATETATTTLHTSQMTSSG